MGHGRTRIGWILADESYRSLLGSGRRLEASATVLGCDYTGYVVIYVEYATNRNQIARSGELQFAGWGASNNHRDKNRNKLSGCLETAATT